MLRERIPRRSMILSLLVRSQDSSTAAGPGRRMMTVTRAMHIRTVAAAVVMVVVRRGRIGIQGLLLMRL